MILFDGNCRVSHKHHHSTKNLSNSQQNSNTNTNSRNVSGEYGCSEDYEEKDSGGGSGRMPATMNEVGVFTTTSARNADQAEYLEKKEEFADNPRNSFYCISMGEMMRIPSQSSINYVSARPSFYSDPTRHCEWDGDLKA